MGGCVSDSLRCDAITSPNFVSLLCGEGVGGFGLKNWNEVCAHCAETATVSTFDIYSPNWLYFAAIQYHANLGQL